ncbi:hypothetical protein I3U54_02995, partial [Mycobacteroides abscessus subsp. abscessus]|nr:hypothetical protein [Mycobacteroides abscessus subsp. abscessus]
IIGGDLSSEGVLSGIRVRAGGLPTSEDPAEPSALFAPSGFLPTDVEKHVEKQWSARELTGTSP